MCYLCGAIVKVLNKNSIMIVTGSTFRSNQSRYVSAAYRGEDVVVKTRVGCYRIVPVRSEKSFRHYDLMEEFRGSVKEAVEALDGKRSLNPAELLSDELHRANNQLL